MLGSGAFGEVRLCTHRESGAKRAVKVQRKSHMDDEEKQIHYNAINTLKNFDHPNILKIYEVFEDEKYHFMVSEYCQGGELLEEIEQRGKFTEIDAAMVIKHVLSCLNYCHSNHIVHRDIQPHNILLEQNKEFDQIKIIDFNSCLPFNDNEMLSTKQPYGRQVYYVAPEFLALNYGPKCDIWSCGVLTYLLLSGFPPFNGASDQEIETKAKYGKISFQDEVWASISNEAKEFISALLTLDQDQRPSAQEALNHPWIAQVSQMQKENLDQYNTVSVLKNLLSFNAQSKLKQATYAFIASQLLSKQEKESIDKVFHAMDTKGDGKLSKEELKSGYLDYYGTSLSEEQVDEIFKQCDIDASGKINYSEFVVAAMNEKDILSNEKLQAAFKMFDKDGSGSISKENIKQVLSFGQELDEEIVQQIIKQVDENKDGVISYEEFAVMMLINNNEQ